jgi:chaperonin cofactor prefoldin
MSKLYELTGQLKELENMDGDEEFAVAIKDTLEAIGGEFNDKALTVTRVALNYNSDIEVLDVEIKRLQDRKKTIKNRHDQLIEYLRYNMEAADIKKVSCPLFTVTLSNGRDVVVIDDEDQLPDEFMRVTTNVAPDKVALLNSLKNGFEVPGARIEKSKSSIRIK